MSPLTKIRFTLLNLASNPLVKILMVVASKLIWLTGFLIICAGFVSLFLWLFT